MAPRAPPPPDPRFDAAYYRRHYRGRGRVHSASEVAALASGVAGLAAWLGLEIRTVLDVGAGPGLWRAWFRRRRPAVRYRSVDVPPYACARWGHERRDVSRWRARARFDLVVCHGVLHYLDARAAARAIENLGAMAGGLLYLEVLAAEDVAVVDREATDLSMPLRPAAWYRTRLARHFVQVGAGLWAARRAGLAFYALEAAS
jgi:SAM-dependent methyltransferase